MRSALNAGMMFGEAAVVSATEAAAQAAAKATEGGTKAAATMNFMFGCCCFSKLVWIRLRTNCLGFTVFQIEFC